MSKHARACGVAVAWMLLLAGCGQVPNTGLAAPSGSNDPAQPLQSSEAASPAIRAPASVEPVSGAEPTTAAALAQPLAGVTYSPPLVITAGGIYEGNWESQDPDTPAVRVSTTEPVVIENSNLRGRGDLIVQGVDGIDLTVRDSRAQALNPEREGRRVGRFARLFNARNVLIEHNVIVGTGGIRLEGYAGDRSGGQTYRVMGNRARNIDGRMSNGSGQPGAAGFYDSDTWCHTYDGSCQGVDYVQFVQLSGVENLPGVEIAYNEVVNEAGESRVEDVISVFDSSGTPDSPIRITGNYIRGAYPNNAVEGEYSGGGIMLGDGRRSPGHVVAQGNVVLNTTNYGIAIASGQNQSILDNRILSTGRLEDGTPVQAQNVGLYVWNNSGTSSGTLPGSEAVGNLVGWEQPLKGGRNDFFVPDVAEEPRNESYSGDVTQTVIDEQYGLWLGAVKAAGLHVGPR